jgi:hypothetical protein
LNDLLVGSPADAAAYGHLLLAIANEAWYDERILLKFEISYMAAPLVATDQWLNEK